MIPNKFLPAGWCEAPLPRVAQVNPGHPIEVPGDDSLVSFVPMASVETLSGRLDPSNRRPWREVKKGYTRFQEGDVLLAKITPSMENGKAAVARGLSAGVGAGSTEFHVLRPGQALRPEFLLNYILQENFRKSARAHMTGTAGQLRVPARFLYEHKIPVPPLPEQDRIVEAIDSYFTRLDDAVATLERVQRNLERYRTSVLRSAVAGCLVPTEAELARAEGRDYEPASDLLERMLAERRRRWEEAELTKRKARGKTPEEGRWKAKYKGPVAPTLNELPSLPEGWCWATASQIAKDKHGAICAGPFGTIFKAKDFRPTGVPIIQLRHVKPDRFLTNRQTFMGQQTWEELFRDDYSVFGGELLVTKLGDPPGDCAIFPTSRAPSMLTPDVMKFEVDERMAIPRFVMHYINSINARRYTFGSAFGTTRLRLTLPLFRAMPIPVPPLAEQEQITEVVDRLLTVVDDVSEGVRRDEDRCARLRQSIFKWAFEGMLVDLDPNDEPASVLLKRIRTEHASSDTKQPRRPGRHKARPPKA